jgi:malate permease and related proteins
MNDSNQVFVITFAVIGLGYLLKRFNYITEQEGKTISKLLMHSTFPALLLLSMSRAKLEVALAALPFIAVIVGSVMLIIAWFVVKNYPNSQRGVLMMGVGGFNTGLFGFPIIEGLFGKEGLGYAIMVDIGVTFMCFGLLYPMAAYFSNNHKNGLETKLVLKKVFSSPPVIATLTGLLINVLAIKIPLICIDFLETLAKGNKPVVLLLMGIYLSFELDKKQRISIYKILTVRYLVGMTAATILYFTISEDKEILRNTLMLCMILPIGMTILPFSDEMNLDTRLAGTLLNISLVVSFILMWGLVSMIKP